MEENLSFVKALGLLIKGKRIARKVWSDKGTYVVLLEEEVKDDAEPESVMVMFDAEGLVDTCWTPSQSDMLSEDWTKVI